MEADSARPLDDLLGHRGWVLALARSLVADPEAAEDVAQETWLAALRSPPEAGRPPRPWLARVVRNLAFQRLRSEDARSAREREAARARGSFDAEGGVQGHGEGGGPGLPPTDVLLERLETQRVLAELLGRLDEPYRTTLLLRYVEGLSSAEIARRQGAPSATVRTRLQRGLELLRARLDARYGDRRSWGLALGVLLAREPTAVVAAGSGAAASAAVPAGAGASAGGAAVLSGVFVMGLFWKLAAAALIVTAGVLFVSRLPEPPGPAAAARTVSPAPAAPATVLEAPERSASSVAAVSPERRSAAASPPAASEAAAPIPAPIPSRLTVRIEGRVVDELGRPLAGARVRGLAEDEDVDLAARSDGGFGLARERGERDSGMVSLAISSPGRATRFTAARLPEEGTAHLGDVVLGPGARIAGRVLGPDGRPAEGARVLVTSPELSWSPVAARNAGPQLDGPVPEASSDAEGRFLVEGVPEGFARVWAVAEGTRYAYTEPLELRAGLAPEQVELELEARSALDVIAGRVLDPEGRGVSTMVQYSFQVPEMSQSAGLQSDEEGRFELRLAALVPHDFLARSPDERWSGASARGVEPGTRELVLRFEESVPLPVRVLGPEGPVEDFSLVLVDAVDGDHLGFQKRAERADGRTEVRAPAAPFLVRVTAPGHAVGTSAELRPGALPELLEVHLESSPMVRGRVVDEHGDPVAGAGVELRPAYGDMDQVFTNGFRVAFQNWAAEADTTDGEGRFDLTLRAPGPHVVLARKDGRPDAVTEVLDLGPLGARDVVVEWLPGGAIEGRVRVDPGVDPSGTVVVVNRGDGEARSRRTGTDGSFRFEDLGAGSWQVLAAEAEIDPSHKTSTQGRGTEPRPFEWHCRVVSGETTWHELDLRAGGGCRLAGSMLLDGRPAGRSWVVHLEHAAAGSETFELPAAALDAEGRFDLAVAEPGEYRLVLSLTEPRRATTVEQRLTLTPGTNHWGFEVETASLAGDNAPTEAESELGLRYLWNAPDRSLTWQTLTSGDDDGRFELPVVPAGRGLLQTFGEPDERGWRTFERALEVDLEPGEREQVVLP